jgi:putative pyoverdin transport system ATP-binding/permease protein
MQFLELIRREMHSSLPKLLFMAGLGGVSTAAILAAINSGMQANSGASALWGVSLFIIALFLFVKTQLYVTVTTTAEIEAIIHKIRLRVMDHVRRSELLPVDAIGRARIIAAVTSDTAILTQASNMLCYTMQGTVLIFFVALYVAYLSLSAFLTTLTVVAIAGAVFHHKNRRLFGEKQKSAEWEGRLFDRLTDFLDGFKEVRLNRHRSDDLFEDALEVSKTAADIKIKSQSETFKVVITSQIAMYVLLGSVVFVAPQFSPNLAGPALAKTTTALMFIVGSCFGLLQSIPVFLSANAAADRIAQLDSVLQKAARTGDDDVVEQPSGFDHIEMRDIRFSYFDKFSDMTFSIGPLDFSLKSGDLVFITGGNGSGKSTFLRVLAGLYPPEAGEITFDGRRLTDHTRDEYRSLVSAIFFDYHLFHRLYGIYDAGQKEIDRLLAKFRLTDKTGVKNGEFRTLDLSGGQRRRLALIVSLLEKRPIVLLDEWTAEQDPEFRRKFYDDLLPEMLRAGQTVVVISHDDRYLSELQLPCRKIRMEEGRIVESVAAVSRST